MSQNVWYVKLFEDRKVSGIVLEDCRGVKQGRPLITLSQKAAVLWGTANYPLTMPGFVSEELLSAKTTTSGSQAKPSI